MKGSWRRTAFLGVTTGVILGVIAFSVITTFPGSGGLLAQRLSLGGGSPVEVGFGEWGSNGRVRIKLSPLPNGKPYQQGRQAIGERDYFLTRVLVLVENSSASTLTVSPAFFFLIDSKSGTLPASNRRDVFPGQLATVRVQPDDNVAGWVLFESFPSSGPRRVVYDDGRGQPVQFLLTRPVK